MGQLVPELKVMERIAFAVLQVFFGPATQVFSEWSAHVQVLFVIFCETECVSLPGCPTGVA